MKRCMAIVGGLVLLLAAAVPVGAATYGPKDHWVDIVIEDTHDMEIDGEFTVDIPGVGSLAFPVTGLMTVWHGDARDTLDPLDPGHLNHVDVEMVSMSLTGTVPVVGTATLTSGDGVGNGLSDGPLFTEGDIIEDTGDPAWADSFFDIFFEIELDSTVHGNITVFNKDALHVSARIDRIPPVGFTYEYHGGIAIPLYSTLDPGGDPVAHIPAASFTPEPSGLVVVCLGGLGLLARRRRRKR
jgi:hypothetical protein